MAVSLDGLVCGPDGADGGLYDWYFDPSDVIDAPAVNHHRYRVAGPRL